MKYKKKQFHVLSYELIFYNLIQPSSTIYWSLKQAKVDFNNVLKNLFKCIQN